jgi:hypothetical protein
MAIGNTGMEDDGRVQWGRRRKRRRGHCEEGRGGGEKGN